MWALRFEHESQRVGGAEVLCRHWARGQGFPGRSGAGTGPLARRRGVPAYVLPVGTLPKPARYVPRIYTDRQLAALFAQIQVGAGLLASAFGAVSVQL